MSGSARGATPWHLWAIGAAAVLWNGFACLDFWETVTRDMAWLANLPPDMIDWLDTTPAWAMAGWALGAWGAFAGALLLLLRSRWAPALFALSLLGLAVNQMHLLGPATPEMLRTTAASLLRIGIWIVALALFGYAAKMRTRGVLR